MQNPIWFRQFSLCEAFNLKHLSLSTLSSVVSNLKRNVTAAQQVNILIAELCNSTRISFQFWRMTIKESDLMLREGCSTACQQQTLCDILITDNNDTAECQRIKKEVEGRWTMRRLRKRFRFHFGELPSFIFRESLLKHNCLCCVHRQANVWIYFCSSSIYRYDKTFCPVGAFLLALFLSLFLHLEWITKTFRMMRKVKPVVCFPLLSPSLFLNLGNLQITNGSR